MRTPVRLGGDGLGTAEEGRVPRGLRPPRPPVVVRGDSTGGDSLRRGLLEGHVDSTRSSSPFEMFRKKPLTPLGATPLKKSASSSSWGRGPKTPFDQLLSPGVKIDDKRAALIKKDTLSCSKAGVWILKRIRNHWGLLLALCITAGAFVALGMTHWKDMGRDSWLAIIIVVLSLEFLVAEVAEAWLIFMVALAVLLLTKVLNLNEALGGFSYPLVFAVACLYAISKAINESTLLIYLLKILGRPKTVRAALIRLLPPVACFSAFMNNTPIVTMLTPAIEAWGRSCQLPVSQLLMPLSFATILGGMQTTIGTSVNLVVNSLATESMEANNLPDHAQLNLFFFKAGEVALPCAIVGIIYMIIFAPIILRKSSNIMEEASASNRFCTQMLVPKDSQLVGQSLKVLGLDQLEAQGINLVALERPLNAREYGMLLEMEDEESDARSAAGPRTPPRSRHDGMAHTGGSADHPASERRSPYRPPGSDGASGGGRSDLLSPGRRQLHAAMSFRGSDIADRSPTIRPRGLSSLDTKFGTEMIELPPPHVMMRENDVLHFSCTMQGLPRTLYELRGLRPAPLKQVAKLPGGRRQRKLVVAVVSPDSHIIGYTAQRCDFRRRFRAAVIGIHRQGQPVVSARSTRFRAGDGLLLEVGDWFLSAHSYGSRDFSVVTTLSGANRSVLPADRPYHAAYAFLIVGGMVATTASGLLPLATATVIAALLFVPTRTLSSASLLAAVKGRTLIIIACALTMGKALVDSGAAVQLSSDMTALLTPLGGWGTLGGLFLITSILANVVNPVAAVTLMYPIITKVPTRDTGDATSTITLNAVVYCYMIAGSTSFLTPFSYQTNLLVAEVAGYRVVDFVRFGLPLVLICAAITIPLSFLENEP